MNDDSELLRRYADDRSEDAFAELVGRHLNFVYGVALRRVGDDTQLAEDVCQDVFTALAGKAAAVARRPVLKGWLHTAAQFSAAQIVRSERRRRTREQEAHTMHELNDDPGAHSNWHQVRPVIDEVIAELGERDRAVVLLRFFEDRSFPDIGERLGLSADGARVRVDRALDKLSALLAVRGIRSTSAALGLCLAHQAGVAAPAGLAPSIITAAASAAGAGVLGPGGVLTGWLDFMTMTQVKTAVLAAVVLILVATVVVQQRTNAKLAEQHDALDQRSERLEKLRAENARLVRVAAEAQELREEQAELARLRALAFEAKNRARTAVPSAANPGDLRTGLIPIDVLRNRGNGTPAAAFETLYWAKEHMDVGMLEQLIAISPESRARAAARFTNMPADLRAKFADVTTPERMALVLWMANNRDTAIQVNTETVLDEDRVYLSGHRQDGRGISNFDIVLRRTPAGWKWFMDDNTVAAALKKPEAKPGAPAPKP